MKKVYNNENNNFSEKVLKLVTSLILLVSLTSIVYGMESTTSVSAGQNLDNCNNLSIQIYKLNQSLENCTYWLSIYESRYLNNTVNVSLGYIIEINQNISNLFNYINEINQTINEIKQETNFLKLELGLSFFSLGSVVGIVIKIFYDKYRKR